MEGPRVYLRLGEKVYNAYHEEWGTGSVVEEMTSTVIGGTALVRIFFEDGHQRTFNNDLNHEMCCAFMGIRREHSFDWEQGRVVARSQMTRAVRATRTRKLTGS